MVVHSNVPLYGESTHDHEGRTPGETVKDRNHITITVLGEFRWMPMHIYFEVRTDFFVVRGEAVETTLANGS